MEFEREFQLKRWLHNHEYFIKKRFISSFEFTDLQELASLYQNDMDFTFPATFHGM